MEKASSTPIYTAGRTPGGCTGAQCQARCRAVRGVPVLCTSTRGRRQAMHDELGMCLARLQLAESLSCAWMPSPPTPRIAHTHNTRAQGHPAFPSPALLSKASPGAPKASCGAPGALTASHRSHSAHPGTHCCIASHHIISEPNRIARTNAHTHARAHARTTQTRAATRRAALTNKRMPESGQLRAAAQLRSFRRRQSGARRGICCPWSQAVRVTCAGLQCYSTREHNLVS